MRVSFYRNKSCLEIVNNKKGVYKKLIKGYIVKIRAIVLDDDYIVRIVIRDMLEVMR